MAAVVCLAAVVFAILASRGGWLPRQGGSRSADVAVAKGDWPWWRGTERDNKALGDPPPVKWAENENIIWKAEVQGRGYASPIVCSDRIFVPTADELEQIQSLLCFSRETGERLWNTEFHRGGFVHKNIKNSHASSTAACDGGRVFVPFVVQGGLWLTATDLDGNILWQKLVAPFDSEHGYASSPAIYKSLVIVASDNLGPSYLTALDRRSGETVWQVPRGSGGSYATPVIAMLAGRPQLLLSGQNSVTSYDPENGEVLWFCSGMASSTIGTIAWSKNSVFATAGAATTAGGTMSIGADGRDDVTNTHITWTSNATANVPSPLVVEDRLVVVQDIGLVTCLSTETGKELWKERLGGNISASPVLAGDLVYLPNEEGTVFVFKAGKQFESVAENHLGDGGFATPVICGGRIYLRTEHHLYCIGH